MKNGLEMVKRSEDCFWLKVSLVKRVNLDSIYTLQTQKMKAPSFIFPSLVSSLCDYNILSPKRIRNKYLPLTYLATQNYRPKNYGCNLKRGFFLSSAYKKAYFFISWAYTAISPVIASPRFWNLVKYLKTNWRELWGKSSKPFKQSLPYSDSLLTFTV